MSEAAAQYKKKDGTVSVAVDGRTVSWTPTSAASPTVSIPLAELINLQQTPATAAKASTKVVVQKPGTQTPENHTFTFTSANARDDQQRITGLIRKGWEASKSLDSPAPASTAATTPAAIPVAIAIAQAVSSGEKPQDDTYDDARLMRDIELQRSLLNSSPELLQRFDQALRDKPESITIIQFSNQFWSTRVHLLRSHAAERSQGAGAYHVLSVVRPAHNKDGELKLNMSKEQIQLIFKQHPLVKRVYNENVPPFSEGDFWSRFFVSRLVKKLRGEKILDTDPLDPKLDKYLTMDDEADGSRLLTMSNIPNFMNVEGNEQNHSQRLGNRPDWTMRPNTNEKVPILRVLNRMSEKMMADVPSSDAQTDRHAPIGVDEETYKQLQLRDLERVADDNRVILKINDQNQLFSAGQGLATSTSAATYAKRTPAQVLSTVQHDLNTILSSKTNTVGLNLRSAIGVEDDSSSEDEEATTKKKARVGSKSTRTAATAQIMKAIALRRLHGDELTSSSKNSKEQAAELGLSPPVFDNLAMTHNTTVEFLHYFWAVFFSGDADRASEAARLIETLDKSLDRIKAVADTAESERAAALEKKRKDNEMYAQRTGKRRRFDPSSIKGGAKTANEIVKPLVRAIGEAKNQYEKAFQEQMARARTST